jgi:4-hydroxybenzoate polyprenyltransferase
MRKALERELARPDMDPRTRAILEERLRIERRAPITFAIMFAGFLISAAPLPHDWHRFLVFLASIVLGCIYETRK